MDWRSAKRAVFARHSNPWSAWTRWATVPLLLVPVWRRSARDGVLVGLWLALNPVVFPEPRHQRAWATRAILGEEQWIAEPRWDAAAAVDVGATVAGVLALVAASKHRAKTAAVATVLEMGLLMAYWELMARHYAASAGLDPSEPGE